MNTLGRDSSALRYGAARGVCMVRSCTNTTFARRTNKFCESCEAAQMFFAKQILARVAAECKVSVTEIVSSRCLRRLNESRNKFVVACRAETLLSWDKIGSLINRSHSAVIFIWRRATGSKAEGAKTPRSERVKKKGQRKNLSARAMAELTRLRK